QYKTAICSLNYNKEKPYELLFATMLSAQCTDKRVNIVTADLFKSYLSLEDFANANLCDIEQAIYTCGFYKTKAKNIIKTAKVLIEEYDGCLPKSLPELTKLYGVGEKTANLIMGDIFHKPAIVCDTHCIRISNRLGFTTNKAPNKVFNDLKKILPPEKSSDFCHRLVLFGREFCKSQKPLCSNCPLNNVCEQNLTLK
ncbi:MAG: endonuclease III, partial [Oscillospiraceae bacterium]